MSIPSREQFLTELWLSYPAFPKQFEKSKACRFLEISDLPMAESLLVGPAKQSLLVSASQLKNLLRPYDWVVAKSDQGRINELYLLAPALVEPLQLQSNQDIQRQWFEFLQQVQIFFKKQKFHQAQTPSLVACPGTEPFLDLFSTEMLISGQKQKIFLTTSPEIHLKKMLAAGYRDIFEIKNCFRNGENSEKHRPEFTMLEWYRAFADLEEIMKDCLDLIAFLKGSKIDFQKVSMAQLFDEKLEFKLTPQTTIGELKVLAKIHGLDVEKFDLWDDVFYFIFLEKIENSLPTDIPLVVEKYPPSQAAFARLTADGWGDRFEIYWKGLEIGNAFHELNNPQIQAERFQEDIEKKQRLGKEIPGLDAQFMQALQSGMPPSSGIAVGLERLFMALNGISRISDLKVF